MANIRTIDDLGLSHSARYATDQEELDQNLVKESPRVGKQAAVDVATPFFHSEFTALLDTNARLQSFATFPKPPDAIFGRRALFGSALVPFLGTVEQKEHKIEHIRQYKAQIKGEKKTENGHNWESDLEAKQAAAESKTLGQLIELIAALDKDLDDINGARVQYHRG